MARGAKPHLFIDNGAAVKRVPSPPSWLSADAKKEWRRTMPILVERRILTTADLGSFENYCMAIGTVRSMDRQLQHDGHVIETEKGLKRHPAVGIRDSAIIQARLLANELGLTPVSRSRPSIREEGDDDDLNPLDIS